MNVFVITKGQSLIELREIVLDFMKYNTETELFI